MAHQSFTLGDIRKADRVQALLEADFQDEPEILDSLVGRFVALAGAHPGNDRRPAMILHVPGRIEVLGKHTDYAGGVSLTCASSYSMVAVVTSHPNPSLMVMDATRGIEVEMPYDGPVAIEGQSWTTYIATVLSRLCRHFGEPEKGISIVLGSNLPSSSGMSSSSGLIITTALSIMGMGRFPDSPPEGIEMSKERFAGFAAALESGADFEDLPGDEGVGTRGGSEDHTAIVCSTAGALRLYSYFPVQLEDQVRLPETLAFVIGSSGVKARKTGDAKEAYNRASGLARTVVNIWNDMHGTDLQTMGQMTTDPLFSREKLRDALLGQSGGDVLWNRFAQFDRECSVVIPGAVEALKQEQWQSFGKYVDESQRMADVWLGNQVPETNELVRLAIQNGAYGASAFGAGFGGAVWALVEKEDAQKFLQGWMQAYSHRFPLRMIGAQFFVDRPSNGVLIEGAPQFEFV